MDLVKGLLFLAILGAAILFGLVVYERIRRSNEGHEFLATRGVSLDYYYKNFLGVSKTSGKLFLNVRSPVLLDTADVRRVEKNSIHQTKRNGYGMQFHSQKGCNLAIHTNSIDEPVIVVSFDDAKDMDLWFARLSAFCNLT